MSEKKLFKENDDKDVTSLSELFDKAFEQFNNINKTDKPTNSVQIQVLNIIAYYFEKIFLLFFFLNF